MPTCYFNLSIFRRVIIVSQRHIAIAGRQDRILEYFLSHHVARHLGYVPHFVRRGCDKTSMRWSLARLLFPPSPDTVFPPSGNDASYGDQEFLSVCTEGNRKLELVPFSGRPRRPAPLRYGGVLAIFDPRWAPAATGIRLKPGFFTVFSHNRFSEIFIC